MVPTSMQLKVVVMEAKEEIKKQKQNNNNPPKKHPITHLINGEKIQLLNLLVSLTGV